MVVVGIGSMVMVVVAVVDHDGSCEVVIGEDE